MICGELLYETDHRGESIPRHYCAEAWGVEHDHDNAARRPLRDGEHRAKVLVLNGEIAQINIVD